MSQSQLKHKRERHTQTTQHKEEEEDDEEEVGLAIPIVPKLGFADADQRTSVGVMMASRAQKKKIKTKTLPFISLWNMGVLEPLQGLFGRRKKNSWQW